MSSARSQPPGFPAVLVLENGRVFRGRGFGAPVVRHGEVVFNTSITGYQEILTDPSYRGQIVVMTAVQQGNVGVNLVDDEAVRPACAGFAVREHGPSSSWRSEGELDAWLVKQGLAAIDELDTRALTRVLRDQGAMRGAIAPDPGDDCAALLAEVRQAPRMDGLDLVPQVTTAATYEWREPSWHAAWEHGGRPPADRRARAHHVVAYDFGIKRAILHRLVDVGCRVTVVPATTPAAEALALGPDGVFLSNGPGDPAAVTYAIDAVRALVDSGKPVFGICLGHQILGLALGARTFKLPFGHHGGNHPVQDHTTGRVEITAQNHGFAVDPASLPAGVRVTHTNLYDNTVEGLEVEGRPVMSVQYHPEAGPGPHDAHYLFRRFTAAMDAARGGATDPEAPRDPSGTGS
ncbi:MAG TPA: glutamine-hydrolyzing carbamoyl-phosphate synthase small subunit [Kofleriaceae bacterium]|nr:glutamine-hydrolyzing carbamoyl-phosphate synthase small subunit [Kofleriaceae bacterium]